MADVNTNTAVVTAANLEFAISTLWADIKKLMANKEYDMEKLDVYITKLNQVIGGNKKYNTLTDIIAYLEKFKENLHTVVSEQSLGSLGAYDINMWVSVLRAKLGVYGAFIYALDHEDVEHFFTEDEWGVVEEAYDEGLIPELPRVFGTVVGNSSGVIIVALTHYTSLAWGGYNKTCGSGTKARLRYLDPVSCKRYYNDNLVYIVTSEEEYQRVIESAPNSAVIVKMLPLGAQTVTKQHYINVGTAEDPLFECVGQDHLDLMGSTHEVYSATAWYQGAQRFVVPFLDEKNILGAPSALPCAKYHAFDDDGFEWTEPSQNNYAAICANFSSINAIRRVFKKSDLPSGHAWSSQEGYPPDAYYTALPAGTTSTSLKLSAYAVVPVAAFKLRNAL